MRKKLIIAGIVTAVFASGGWLSLQRRLPPGKPLPKEVRSFLDTTETFSLLSLNPTKPVPPEAVATWAMDSYPPSKRAAITNAYKSAATKETFHEYIVLGRADIRDAGQRRELLRALYKGIARSGGRMAACFNPRHGIHATRGGKTVDLLICFECSGIAVYADTETGATTSNYPQPTFDSALQRAGVLRPTD